LRRGRRKDSENRSRSSWWKVGEPDIKLTRLSRMQTSGARVHLKARNRSGERFLRTGMDIMGRFSNPSLIRVMEDLLGAVRGRNAG